MSGFLHTLFDWPEGIVVGNLIASAIWVPVSWLGTHLLLRYHHKKISDLLRHHDRP